MPDRILGMSVAGVMASMNHILLNDRLPDVQVAGITGEVVTVRCPGDWNAAKRGEALRAAQRLLRQRWHPGFRVQLEPSADINSMRRLRGIVDIEAV